jgi:hypothetical protein
MKKVTERQLHRKIELCEWELEYYSESNGLMQVRIVETDRVMTVRLAA